MPTQGFALITTGGTFDKHYPDDKGSYAFTFGAPASLAILERARVEAGRHIALAPKDSMDMTDDDREAVARACADAEEGTIIITHGTDSMIQTADVIAQYFLKKVIVLVGAAQPECMKNTDADFNLGFALGAATATIKRGVYIAMNGKLFIWSNCVKLDDGTFTTKD